jgi:hypothetical protein
MKTDKHIDVLENGKVVVIKPADLDKIIVPFFCPSCEYPMKTAEDASSFRRSSKCEMCELCQPPSENKTDPRWISYMERRHRAFLPTLTMK